MSSGFLAQALRARKALQVARLNPQNSCGELFRDWRYVCSLIRKNFAEIEVEAGCVFYVVPNFFARHIGAITFVEFESVRAILKVLELHFTRNRVVVIRGSNFTPEQVNEISCGAGVSILRLQEAYGQFPDMYQSEENFPQVIYHLPMEFRTREGASFGEQLLDRPGLSGKRRVDLRRILRIWESVTPSSEFDYDCFDDICSVWKRDHFHGRGISPEFDQYWWWPIANFLGYMEELGNLRSEFQVRCLKDERTANGGRGYWIGGVEGEVLYVYQMVHDRRSSVFGDVLLLDSLSEGQRLGLRYVNVGGAESASLYSFKRKLRTALAISEIHYENVVVLKS